MMALNREVIRSRMADSDLIFKRGLHIYQHGAFSLREADREQQLFIYDMDGNYGDYVIRIQMGGDTVQTSCDCPYPGKGCKHTVAALLNTRDLMQQWQNAAERRTKGGDAASEAYLIPDEIRQQALDDRTKRARNESFDVFCGDMFKGEHLLETRFGRTYTVTLHDPVAGRGHCSCPDYLTNRLGTCKHLLFIQRYVKQQPDFNQRVAAERFPFVDIFWDSVEGLPRIFNERPPGELEEIQPALERGFDTQGRFKGVDMADFMPLLKEVDGHKRVRIQPHVLQRVDEYWQVRQAGELAAQPIHLPEALKVRLYPYQEEGVRFCLHKRAALIGDEMGLGKTLQAIVLAILKKEAYGFDQALIVTLASLKEQWKREIERFTDQKAVIIAGNPRQRQQLYLDRDAFFKIANYESVLRDATFFNRYKPPLVILDEAQRIKNFSTKTADAVKRIPRKHALVLTGTPLENKLEDVYSIVQFLDPYLLAPLWKFAADHFMISRARKDKILGYHNLAMLHDKLKPIVIRRKKQEVLKELPDRVLNTYYVDLHEKQAKIHSGLLQSLMPILNKKFLTPMDVRHIQMLMLKMRMVCNSTYLVDRRTYISPKLKELEGVLEEIVVQNGRKTVIFSEWTTMTFLIARHLSEAGIPFVELSGKIPVNKRQALIDEFTDNPDCKVFLSTDAGGTGLNLQAADCVINFELPWNPARLNQRVGRVHRIGQQSGCINVVNLIAKNSIEEKILAGLQLKTALFQGVFEGGEDMVDFSHEKRNEMLNRLREMLGEEPEPPPPPEKVPEEIPEDTPHYLNPKVLGKEAAILDVTEETPDTSTSEALVAEVVEPMIVTAESATFNTDVAPVPPDGDVIPEASQGTFSLAAQPPEKVEAVLNTGMQFIDGLLEMATGQKLNPTSEDGRLIHIDRQTGEVTMKFKLPGF